MSTTVDLEKLVSLKSIREAQKNLNDIAVRTPLDHSTTFSRQIEGEVYLKLENLQLTGSFKLRGAYNKIESLSRDEKARGVIAASAGNHAQGVALGANHAGIGATIVMPKGAPISKVQATRSYGANVILHGANYDEAYQRAKEIQVEEGSTFIHAFDDPAVIAGQGTIGLEILSELPEVDYIFAPIGGGGLISGIATAVKSINPRVKIIGVEAAGAACALASRRQGEICVLDDVSTIADGIAVKRPGDLTFELIQKYVDDVITVDDEEIASAILSLLERSKTVAEAAGATGLAGILHGDYDLRGKNVAAIISGGNIDTPLVSAIIERGLVKDGRLMNFHTTLPDIPGALQKLLKIIGDTGANVISVIHNRLDPHLSLRRVTVHLTLETRDKEHGAEIFSRLAKEGYIVTEHTHGTERLMV